jgi:MFS transporter, OFA family, oxalate/formate antiporter
VALQLGMGSVYAWSVYRPPLTEEFGWSITQVTLTFSILVLVAGFSCFLGGLWMSRAGPRRVALTGGIVYAAGIILASLSGGHLWLLYATIGVMGGLGLGLAYIVPIATLVKWFPEQRGFATGVAIMGVSIGGLVFSPITAQLIAWLGVLETFAVTGTAYLLLIASSALALSDPPAGYRTATAAAGGGAGPAAVDLDLRGAVRTWQWYLLWVIFFLNVVAGIGFVSEEAPIARELVGVTALAAASLAGITFFGDGVGRLAWPWLSDVTGRRIVLVTIFLLQAACFALLSVTSSTAAFVVLGTLILFCYGGSSGTVAAVTSDLFGPRDVGSIYGLLLTSWGFGGLLGPLMVAAVRESTGSYATSLQVLAAIMLGSVVLPLVLRPVQGR